MKKTTPQQTPIIIIVIPGVVLSLRKMMLKVSVNLCNELKETTCECQSPYHWIYDWYIPERDRRELHLLLEAQTNGHANGGTIDIVMRELVQPRHKHNMKLSAAQLTYKTSAVRQTTTPFRIRRLIDGEPRWESTIVLGRHGCWLCSSCCLLEQLFPTRGVGAPGDPNCSSLEELINGSWYSCKYPEHEVTPRALYQTFRGELLVACLARHKVKEALRFRKSLPSLVELGEIIETCFGNDSRVSSKEKLKRKEYQQRATRLKDSVEDETEVMFEVDELLDEMFVNQEDDTTTSFDTYAKRLSSYALASMPPYPDKVPQHAPFAIPDKHRSEREEHGITWSAFADNPKLKINEHDPKLSITRKRETAFERILYENDGIKLVSQQQESSKDNLTMSREHRAGEAVWQIKRTDPVTKETKQWITRQGPATPPRTPPQHLLNTDEGRQVTVPSFVLSKKRPEKLPKWYRDFVIPYRLGSNNPRTKRDMVSLPATGEGQPVFDLLNLSTKIPCNELYAMTRLRRARDKLDEWKSRGYTDDEIKQRFVAVEEAIVKEQLSTQLADEEEVLHFDDEVLRKSLTMVNGKSFIKSMYLKNGRDEKDHVEDVEVRKAMLVEADKKMNVIEECQVCYSDFAVWFCPHHNKSYCEQCYEGIHRFGAEQGHRKYKLAPQPKMSHLAEEGGIIVTRTRDVYTVAVLVIIFLMYPSLMKEIALMLNCTDTTCVDSNTCHPFLVEDPSIDCSTSKYATYKLMSLILFFLYGFGLPLGGWAILYRNLRGLRTKEVMATLGFLYSGYRQKRWYWEMVIMVRKMFMVFIVVFLARNAEYQLWAAMWTIAFFLFLNVTLRPFKFTILWVLENISLICMVITLNLAMFYFSNLNTTELALLTWSIVGFNVSVLMVFVLFIVRDLVKEITKIVDTDGDGNIGCDEAKDYLQGLYQNNKPKFLRRRQDVIKENERVERRRKWLGIDMMQRRHKQKLQPEKTLDCTSSYGYWMEKYDAEIKGENRFAFVERKADDFREKTCHQKKQLSMDEVSSFWGIVYGEITEQPNNSSGFIVPQNELLNISPEEEYPDQMNPIDVPDSLPSTPSITFREDMEYSPAGRADSENQS